MYVFLCCNGVPHVPPPRGLQAGGGWRNVSCCRPGREHIAALPPQVLSCNPSVHRSPAPRLGVSAACVLGELIRVNPINISQRCGPVIIARVIWDAGWDGGAVPSETGELPRLYPGSLGIRGAKGAGHGRFYPLPWVGVIWQRRANPNVPAECGHHGHLPGLAVCRSGEAVLCRAAASAGKGQLTLVWTGLSHGTNPLCSVLSPWDTLFK